MEIILATRVFTSDLGKVNAFEELKVDLLLRILFFSNVEDLVGGHTLTALL